MPNARIPEDSPPHAGPPVEPWSHQWHDALALAYHFAVAEKIAIQPELRSVAIGNIDLWMARNDYPPSAARALLWWRDLLVNASVQELIAHMNEPGETGDQRRQNTPFAGILTPEERLSIRQKYETAAVA